VCWGKLGLARARRTGVHGRSGGACGRTTHSAEADIY
jgi:hypothetical protein